MKQIIFFMLILSLTFIQAVDIYSGESYNITLEKPFEYFSIVGNSSEVIINITQTGNDVIIYFNKYNPTDTFEIIFFDITDEVIVQYHSSGGGGSSRTVTKYVDRNVTTYLDRPVVENKETIKINEVEKIVKTKPSIYWIILPVILLLLIFIFEIISYFKVDKNIDERGYEKKDE